MPPANYVHPEFGYLCPTSRLRRDFRVAVVSIVLGGIIGAIVVTLRDGHDRSDSAMMVARVEHPAETAPATAPEAVQGATDVSNPKHEAIKHEAIKHEAINPEAIKHEAVKTERMRIDAVKAAAAEPVTDGAKTERSKMERGKIDGTKTDGSKIDGAKTHSVKTDSVKTDGTKADATKSTCEDNTWSYLDGTCVAGKPRRVKVRAATDNPAIGAAPLGRTVSTSVAAPAPAAANASQSAVSAAATPSNAATPAETSQPPAAAATKKPQKVVRSQSRASDRSVRDERASSSARGYVGYANAPGPYRQGPPNQGYFGWYW